MNIDDFLDQQAPDDESAPTKPQTVTIESHYKTLQQMITQNDAQHALEAFMRLHDAIMREHESEHNPAHHQLLAQAKQELRVGLLKAQERAQLLVRRLYDLLVSSTEASALDNLQVAMQKYDEGKKLFEEFPSGFDQLKEQAHVNLLKLHALLRQKRIDMQRRIHSNILTQLHDIISKTKIALEQNQLQQATALSAKAHQLYAQLPAGFALIQSEEVFMLIALDYQMKMKTTISELSSYAQMYQIPAQAAVIAPSALQQSLRGSPLPASQTNVGSPRPVVASAPLPSTKPVATLMPSIPTKPAMPVPASSSALPKPTSSVPSKVPITPPISASPVATRPLVMTPQPVHQISPQTNVAAQPIAKQTMSLNTPIAKVAPTTKLSHAEITRQAAVLSAKIAQLEASVKK